MRITAILFALLAGTALSPTTAAAQDPAPVAEASGSLIAGGGTGTISLMVPWLQPGNQVVFTDARAHLVDGGAYGASLGLGARAAVTPDWTLGANVYLDYLDTARDNGFTQAGFGLEAFHGDLEVRANAYLPLGDRTRADHEFDRLFLDSGQLFFRQGQEQALRGADAEIGGRLPVFAADSPVTLKAFVGGFVHDGEGIDTDPGVSTRAELSFAALPGLAAGSALTVGLGATYSERDKGDLFASLRLRVPLGGQGGRNTETDPMLRRVERAPTIRTHVGTTGAREATVFADSGEMIGGVAELSAASGDAAALNALAAAQGRNGLLLASGTIDLDAPLVLGTEQRLLGANQRLAVRSARSGIVTSFGTAGPNAVLRGTNAAADVLVLGDGATVAQIGVVGGRNGIAANSLGGVLLSDVTVSGAAANGIALSGVDRAVLRNVTVVGAGANGLAMSGGTSLVAANLVLADTGSSGIRLDGVGTTTLETVTVRNTGGIGVAVQGGASFQAESLTVANSGADALVLDGIDRSRLTALSVSHAQGRGIAVNGGSDLELADVSVSDTGDDGIRLDGVNRLSAEAIRIARTSGTGLTLNGGSNVAIAGALVADTAAGGVVLNGVDGFAGRDLRIARSGAAGVTVNGGRSFSIGGLEIANTASDAVTLNGVDSATLSAGRLERTGGSGIVANGGASFSASDLAIASVGATGMTLNAVDRVALNAVRIAATGTEGLVVNDAGSLTAVDLGVARTGGDGVQINRAGQASFVSLLVSDVGGNGVTLNQGAMIAFDGVAIGNVGGNGLGVTNVAGLSLADFTVDGAGQAGFRASGASRDFDGDLTVRNSARACSSDGTASLTQTGGAVFTINGVVTDPATCP
ncbi:hypothetical protein GCM10011390_44510 [Aureimonas endophytica]|uniref:Inverse autotransporter beta-domain domain-containing protein n=1 Tax=Aureimonas endophytica TaxID=2027858 RepID=A0A917EC79_9HYPH|nr:right-handed parallel beta-helix repeat-containing protein [Aureimonas endophytica]GGE20347.1 hypothetical protein GCM10011390_44510 [Aureimonas endophytica]